MTVLYLCVFVAIIAHALYSRTDLFSPFRVFALAYSSNLAIEALKLSKYQGPWSSTTHMLFWGSVAMFIGGCLVARLMRAISCSHVAADPESLRPALAKDAASLDWRRFAVVFYVTAGVYLLGYCVAYALVGAIPAFSSSPDYVRLRFIGANRFTNMAWFFGPAALILAAEYLMFAVVDRRSKLWVGTLAVVVLLTYLTYLTRVDLFRALAFATLLFHYGRSSLKLKHLVLVGTAFVFVFVVFALVRATDSFLFVISTAEGLDMPPWLLWAAQPYMYIVGNFWNMDHAFRTFVDGAGYYPREWGFELLRPFLGLVGLEGAFLDSYGFDGVFNESIVKHSFHNSTNYVWHLYKDFGTVGLYVQTFLVGLVASVFYHNTFVRPTLLRISTWCVFAGLIGFSVTTAFWTMWFVYMNLVLLAFAHGAIAMIGVQGRGLGEEAKRSDSHVNGATP